VSRPDPSRLQRRRGLTVVYCTDLADSLGFERPDAVQAMIHPPPLSWMMMISGERDLRRCWDSGELETRGTRGYFFAAS